jgi:hypothetical protein
MTVQAEVPQLAVGDGGPVRSKSCHWPPTGSTVAFGSEDCHRAEKGE